MADRMDRASIVERMYQGYLNAHDRLAAGTRPGDIEELTEFSSRLGDDTTFRFPSLALELRGREAIEQFMVDVRRSVGLREWSERVVEHGDFVISLNRSTVAGGDEGVPVVAVFKFAGGLVTEFWGFASGGDIDG